MRVVSLELAAKCFSVHAASRYPGIVAVQAREVALRQLADQVGILAVRLLGAAPAWVVHEIDVGPAQDDAGAAAGVGDAARVVHARLVAGGGADDLRHSGSQLSPRPNTWGNCVDVGMNAPLPAAGFDEIPRPCSASVPSDAPGIARRGTAGGRREQGQLLVDRQRRRAGSRGAPRAADRGPRTGRRRRPDRARSPARRAPRLPRPESACRRSARRAQAPRRHRSPAARAAAASAAPAPPAGFPSRPLVAARRGLCQQG